MEKNEQEAGLRKSGRLRLLFLDVFEMPLLPKWRYYKGSWIYEIRVQEVWVRDTNVGSRGTQQMVIRALRLGRTTKGLIK